MKSCLECIPCFVRQTLDAARMATDNEELHERILKHVLSDLQEIDWAQSPPEVAARIHRIIREHTDAVDPYRDIKDHSTRKAEELCAKWGGASLRNGDSFDKAARLAIAGNIIDFGAKRSVSDDEIEAAITDSLDAPIAGDGIAALQAEVEAADSILYLADNAGETVFDRLFIGQMPREKVTYVVKGVPCINDATLEDAQQAGLTEIVEVIDNGSDAPGTVLPTCSKEFVDRFYGSDLVISKGQGNYESLSHVNHNIAFLLKAKCAPVAEDAGCEVGSLVIRIRKTTNSK